MKASVQHAWRAQKKPARICSCYYNPGSRHSYRPFSTSKPRPDILNSGAEIFLSLPNNPALASLLPKGHEYTSLIIISAILLRTVVSLPISVWARHSQETALMGVTRRLRSNIPATAREVLALEQRIPKKKIDAPRDARLKIAAGSLLKEKVKAGLKAYGYSPYRSLVAHLGLNIPAFLVLTMIIRRACQMSIPFAYRELQSQGPSISSPSRSSANISEANSAAAAPTAGFENVESIEIGHSAAEYMGATQLAQESLFWVPSLVETDVTLVLPMTVGLISLITVEVQVWGRNGSASESTKEVNSLERRRKVNVQKLIPNALRLVSLVSVYLASLVPGGVLAYWLSSGSLGLAQAVFLRKLDLRSRTKPDGPDSMQTVQKQLFKEIDRMAANRR